MNRVDFIKQNKAESPLEELMMAEFAKYDLRPEQQFEMGNYRIDFAFPEKLLAIEVDGWVFHKDRKEYDEERDDFIRSQGWKVLRFSYKEVLKQASEIVKSIISDEVFKSRKDFPKPKYDWPEINEAVMEQWEINEAHQRRQEILDEEADEELMVRGFEWKTIKDLL